MNDLRLPLLRATAPNPPSSPADAASGAAGGADNGFDRVLARSRAPDARSDDLQRAAEPRSQPARNTAPADARAPARSPARAAEQEKSEPDATAAAAAAAAADAAHAERESAAADASSDAATGDASAPTPAAPVAGSDTARATPVLDLAAQTAALVAAATALTASPRAAGAPASAAHAEADADAGTDVGAGAGADAVPLSADPLSTVAGESAAARATAVLAAAADARKHGAVKDAAPADAGEITELAAGSAQTLQDRLAEDFERRFETSLARTVGAAPGHAGPLAAAGLPALAPAPAVMHSMAHASVAAPLGHPTFADDLSYRVLMFAGQRVQNAELSVTPADLGPVSVAIEVRGQEASLAFGAAHATTRAAIEDALPRLREMLAAQGLHLAQANVGDAPRRGRGDASADRGRGTAPGAVDGARAAQAAAGTGTVRRLGLIDIHV